MSRSPEPWACTDCGVRTADFIGKRCTRCHAATLAPMAPRGRPPQDGTKRDRSIRVMCHSEQETTWRLAAESDGQDLSSWVRDVLDDAARKQLAGDRAGDRDR